MHKKLVLLTVLAAFGATSIVEAYNSKNYQTDSNGRITPSGTMSDPDQRSASGKTPPNAAKSTKKTRKANAAANKATKNKNKADKKARKAARNKKK